MDKSVKKTRAHELQLNLILRHGNGGVGNLLKNSTYLHPDLTNISLGQKLTKLNKRKEPM